MRSLYSLMTFCLILVVLVIRALASETGLDQVDQETRLWQRASLEQIEYEQRHTLLENDGLTTDLETILSRLWQQAQTDLPPMTLKVIQEPGLNAFTYPNGVSYITTGMLIRLQNQDQLAMVLAHEMIHYLRRHTLEALGHLQMNFAKADDQTDHGSQLSPVRGRGLSDFSAAAEKQADQQGLGLLRKAGFCTSQVIALLNGFNGMEGISPNETGHLSNLASSSARLALATSLQEQESDGTGCERPVESDRSYLLLIAPALLANAHASFQRGLWEGAEHQVARYLAIFPNDPDAHFLQGELLWRRNPSAGEQQRAVSAFQEAIRLDQGFAPAYRALGVVHFKSGDKKKAKDFFETYLSLAPNAQGSDFIRGYLTLCRE